MKNTLKTMLCIVLVFAVLASLTSCVIIEALNIGGRSDTSDSPAAQPGYTGGGILSPLLEPHAKNYRTVHWVETYEEAMTVIEGLRKAGNKLPEFYLPNYDNDAVDAKYVFLVNNYGAERLTEGQEWYERKLNAVEQIHYFGFLEKVSIETLEFGYYDEYKCIHAECFGFTSVKNDYVDKENFQFECGLTGELGGCMIKWKGKQVMRIQYECMVDYELEMPDGFHDDFMKSLTWV